MIYLLVGVLALRIAFGDSGEQADRGGALTEIAARPFGSVLIWALGLGLAGMALWRLSEAGFGAAGPDGHKAGTRLLSLARCLFYAVVSFSVLSFAAGKQGSGSGASDQQSRDATAKALDLPGGPWLVAAAGVGIAVAGSGSRYAPSCARSTSTSTGAGCRHVRARVDVLGVSGGSPAVVCSRSPGCSSSRPRYLRPRQGQRHGRHAPLLRGHLGGPLAARRDRRRPRPVRPLLLRDGPVAQRLNGETSKGATPSRRIITPPSTSTAQPESAIQHVRPLPCPMTGAHRRMTETHQNARTAPSRVSRGSLCPNGRWHLEVASLDREPETGDTEALLVTLWPVEDTPDGTGFPAVSLREQLHENGFALADPDRGTGGWTPTGDRGRYAASCYPTDEATA